MSVARLTLVLAMAPLVGCGSSSDTSAERYAGSLHYYPVLGCESLDAAPCDVFEPACQQRLLGLAACLRGSEPGELPPIDVITTDEYRTQLNELVADEEPYPHLENWDAAFSELGLIQSGAFSNESQVEEAVAFVAAFYSSDSKSITLIDQQTEAPDSASVLLLHELVHALEDRDVDLRAYRETLDEDAETNNAVEALIEGEARFHELRYAASAYGFDPAAIDWREVFENSVATSEDYVFEQASPLIAGNRYFPYVWGARYLHYAWPVSGHGGVLDRYASPLVSTRALMASSGGVAEDDFAPSVPSSPASPPAFALVGTDTLGAFDAFLLFGSEADRENARFLADGWRGDTLSIYAGSGSAGPSATVLVWTVDLAETERAQAVATLLGDSFEEQSVRREGTRVTLALSTNGQPLDWAFASPDP